MVLSILALAARSALRGQCQQCLGLLVAPDGNLASMMVQLPEIAGRLELMPASGWTHAPEMYEQLWKDWRSKHFCGSNLKPSRQKDRICQL